MRILNFGSLNIDRVYRVDHFVRPGETLASIDFRESAGGKGLNQSLALARGGRRRAEDRLQAGAHDRGYRNAALARVDWLVVNAVEGAALTGEQEGRGFSMR